MLFYFWAVYVVASGVCCCWCCCFCCAVLRWFDFTFTLFSQHRKTRSNLFCQSENNFFIYCIAFGLSFCVSALSFLFFICVYMLRMRIATSNFAVFSRSIRFDCFCFCFYFSLSLSFALMYVLTIELRANNMAKLLSFRLYFIQTIIKEK